MKYTVTIQSAGGDVDRVWTDIDEVDVYDKEPIANVAIAALSVTKRQRVLFVNWNNVAAMAVESE